MSSTTQACVSISGHTRSAQARTSSAGSQGESARNCCRLSKAGGVFPQAEKRRPETLATPVFDEAAHIKEGVLPLPHVGEARHHLPDEGRQAFARVGRRHIRRHCVACIFPSFPT